MAFLALIIGVVLIVSAIRNTHTDLLAAIRQDVPAFAIWGAAILGVAAIGFIPGLKPVSRGLLALVIVVIILTNYKQLVGAFTGAAFGSAAQAAGGDAASAQQTSNASNPLAMMGQLATLGGFDFTDLLGTTEPDPGSDNSAVSI